jgi:ABC-type sulfate/molybdate transport systems ATPase subunit
VTVLTVDVRVEVRNFSVDARLTASPGFTALIGPSGSGKSLTLAAIAGTIRPVRGCIRFADQTRPDETAVDQARAEQAHANQTFADVERGIHLRSQERGIGMVFQHAALLEHLSPLDNVVLAVRNGNRATRREVAAALLERVGAAHRAAARTRTLSGGERQRVALARAMAGNPRILLLDEPFSSLDAATREQMRSLVRTLVDERGITALLVTHDAGDVAVRGDRVVQYEPGRTVSAGE